MRYNILPLFAAALLVLSCTPGNETDSGDPYVKFETPIVQFDSAAGSTNLQLSSNCDWTAYASSGEGAWVTVSPEAGSGDATLTITVTENPDKENERIGKVFVSYSGGTISATLTQAANPAEGVFSITPNEVSIGGDVCTFDVTIVSDAVDYDITVVDDWLSIASRTGDRHTGETVTFAAKANPDGNDRHGVVSVCTKNGSCIPVMITQAAANPFYARHHVALRFTATWCGYCPYMDEAFHTVAGNHADFDYMTVHASEGYPLYFSKSGTLASTYKITGFPTGILNGWTTIDNYTQTSATASNIVKSMNDFNSKFSCVAGIAFSSRIEGGKVLVDATVETGVSEKFKISAFVLESGIVQAQTYYPSGGGSQNLSDFVHDNVARATLTKNALGDEFTSKSLVANEFSWSATLDGSWDSANLSVLVYVQRSYGDDAAKKADSTFPNTYVVNARSAAVGETVTLEYAE